MDVRPQSTSGRSYEDFEPSLDWTRQRASDTIRLVLPAGFKTQHLKVQLDNYGSLHISGEHPLIGNKWSRFHTQVSIPDNCDVDEIKARFENGALQITWPKKITLESTQERPTPTTMESPKSQKTQEKPDSATGRDKEGAKPTSTASGIESTDAAGFAEKQMKGSTDAADAKDHVIKKREEEIKKKEEEIRKKEEEIKKKEEEIKEKEETREMVEPSTKTAVEDVLVKESYMHGGGGWVLGMDESRQLMVNVIVGFLVLFALLMYISSKLAS